MLLKPAPNGSAGCIICGANASRLRLCWDHIKIMRYDQQMRFDLHIPDCEVEGCRRMMENLGRFCGRHYEAHLKGNRLHSEGGHLGDCRMPGCSSVSLRTYPLCRVHRKRATAYGMTVEELLEMMGDDPKCTICGSKEAIAVDHDHSCCPQKYGTCGKCNRGLLCRSCNMALGSAKDNPQTLRALADYLDAF